MVRIIPSTDQAALSRLFARRGQRLEKAEAVVAPILEAVRKVARGESAFSEVADLRPGPKKSAATGRCWSTHGGLMALRRAR